MRVNKCFIDTNIFLRLIVADQKTQHEQCVAFFQKVQTGEFLAYTSSLVFAEINWTLRSFYGYEKQRVITGLRSLIGAPYLQVTNLSNMEIALDFYSHFSVKYIDAVIASHPDIYSGKMSVVSYDKDFDKLGVIRCEPNEIL